MRYVMLLVMLLGLGGCAGPEIKQSDVDMDVARSSAKASCVTARAQADATRMQAISRMPESQQAIAMMADAMARQSEALAGKDPCAMGANAHETRARIAASQNETIQAVGKPAIAAGGAVGGIWAVGKATADVAERSGNRTEINGDGNTYSNEQVTSNSDQRLDAGDESTVSATAPTVTGPDKHSETTTEMVAPETAVPVVAE